jgi:hypothetical protein
MWMLGYKWRPAFLFSIAGEAIWAVDAYQKNHIELAVICAVFCIVTARNWWKWA